MSGKSGWMFMHFVMIFLDGFGLGSEEDNPIVAARTPHLDELLGGHFLWGKDREIVRDKVYLVPLDASLDVPGIPQSATGQTTLWTGENGAKAIGRHLNAYPDEKLVQIINEKSIFKQLADRGKRVTFANTFTDYYEELVATRKRRHTASTLSALAGGLTLRMLPELLASQGVYQDMTHEILREMYPEVPLISPYKAGENLGKLALGHDFTLYEFFQTDYWGHRQNWDKAVNLMEQIDEFIGGFMSIVSEQDVAWLLTSDHGNIEDLRVRSHTENPVPALLWSNLSIEWPKWRRLEDVTPTIVKLLTKNIQV